MLFRSIRRLLEWTGAEASSRTPWAVFGALLFLLHPLQVESVAYISGRSDSLCGMLSCASFAAFLCRRSPAISWAGVLPVLLLFGAAVLTKEQAVALPALKACTRYRDFIRRPSKALSEQLSGARCRSGAYRCRFAGPNENVFTIRRGYISRSCVKTVLTFGDPAVYDR